MTEAMPFLRKIILLSYDPRPFREVPLSNADAIWIQPFLVGTVTFMQYTREGNMRQPVFKGLRDDKLPMECCV